jgi:hypothetical protein
MEGMPDGLGLLELRQREVPPGARLPQLEHLRRVGASAALRKLEMPPMVDSHPHFLGWPIRQVGTCMLEI